MSWITITEADVLTVLPGPQLGGIRAAALADGQVDPVQPSIDQVVNQVRSYLGTRYQLGAEGTISDKVLGSALDLIACRIPQRVGEDPSEGRQKSKAEAIKFLERVSEGKADIEEPLIPATETSGQNGSFVVVKSSTRLAGRDNMAGL